MRTAKDIEEALAAVGTAERAEGSKRYLKSSMRHLGASVTQIRAEAKGTAKEVGSRRELRELADELWVEPVLERRACAAFLLDYRVDPSGRPTSRRSNVMSGARRPGRWSTRSRPTSSATCC